MDEKRIHVISFKLSDQDYKLLNALIKKTQEETNMRVTKPNMFSKLIRDEAERKGVTV